MRLLPSSIAQRELAAKLEGLERLQAVIEFAMDGTVLTANDNFLALMGYRLGEIKGRPHSQFVEPAYGASAEYARFWDVLRRGERQSAEFPRMTKDNREVWIKGSYVPILGRNGVPYKVVKFGSDITEQVRARQKSDAVRVAIEQSLDMIDRAITSADCQSASAADASGQTSSNVQAVAAGAEQLHASVLEIARSMAKSKIAADGAFQQAVTADQATQRLSEAARAMGGIVTLIRNITSQINLLALNATIESARAGEAGRGFAVVANEVKNLAKQASAATEEISREIDGMQGISADVVQSLSAIRASIDHLREYVTSTAGAIEEQSAVAQNMSSNMQDAANAVGCITDSIGHIAEATQQANAATKQVKEAALSLGG